MKCKHCGNTLEFIKDHEHECVETNDIVVHDVNQCPKCLSLHYRDGNDSVFEFFLNLQNSKVVMLVTDQEVAKQVKLKEKEVV